MNASIFISIRYPLQVLIQCLFPGGISSCIFCTMLLVWFNNLQLLQGSESLISILIDTSTHACALGSTNRAISIVKFNRCTTHASQCITEQRA
ncbi:hypothetical protein SAMN04487900_11433 [Prevotella communis]|uniref:Uncharacterized protein n=1 Tax=Prevotella communis TaxID=2913614 RepID=A0A1H0IC15_9BACT|nr:hypothetical protein SAMN04487900_11433 [Prevotella communis]